MYQKLNSNGFKNPTTPIRWDAHACPPLKVGKDLSFLKRYHNADVNFVSLNIGFDLTTQDEALNLAHYFREWISNNDDYMLIDTISDVLDCQKQNKLGIAFDLEGCNVLNANLDMVSHFYNLGVRQMLFAYNNNNIAGGGCLEDDLGLTHFGKQLLKKCNDIGMVIDCSHLGYRTSMDIMEYSQFPVVFSHSNLLKLTKHPRNISDDQIIRCAQTNGVIGINGIGIFLGNNDIRTQKIVEHIDYVAQLVGSEHVGIGLDCIFDDEEISTYVKNNPETFPATHGFNNAAVAIPEQFMEIGELLQLKGYADYDINNILGNNFFRVASTVWK